MSSRTVTPEEFAAAARAGHAEGLSLRLAATTVPELGQTDRIVRYVFSDASVGRDGFTIAQDGWILDDFLANPVFLWGHDDLALPIGRVAELGVVGGKLRGAVEYMAPELNLFADTVYRMVRGGYLNAVSTRWLPVTWRYSTDKSRPGAIDFTSQELLEVSQVCVPGLATALAEARRAGIDTEPMFQWAGEVLDRGGMTMVAKSEIEELRRAAKMRAAPTPKQRAAEDWKCGADRALPIDSGDTWDGPAAATRMLDDAGFDGDSPDLAKARRGFLAYDAGAPELRGSYKLPFADLVDGELKAMKGGVDAAAQRLSGTDVPDAVKTEAQVVIDAYQKKMGESQGAKTGLKRGLYEVGWLAMILSDLGWLEDCVEFEAALEEDASQVPQMLADALKALGAVLIAMTVEEVAELVAGEDDEANEAGDTAVMMASGPGLRRQALRLAGAMLRERKAGRSVTVRANSAIIGVFGRAGRVLSADNERSLTTAHDKMEEARGLVRGVLDQMMDDPVDCDENPDDPACDQVASIQTQREARERRLRVARAAAE